MDFEDILTIVSACAGILLFFFLCGEIDFYFNSRFLALVKAANIPVIIKM
jgi:hypothetical protein